MLPRERTAIVLSVLFCAKDSKKFLDTNVPRHDALARMRAKGLIEADRTRPN